MHLKAKRLVRTPYSEQYALFDLDRTDDSFDPLSVGKLDIHYTQHGIYGTLLFWQDACDQVSKVNVLREAEALMAEFQLPMGVPAEYAIEFFSPALSQYELLSNIDSDEAAGQIREADGIERGDAGKEDTKEEPKIYRSIWPLPVSQGPPGETGDDPGNHPYDMEADEATAGAEEQSSPPSTRSGTHSQLRWI